MIFRGYVCLLEIHLQLKVLSIRKFASWHVSAAPWELHVRRLRRASSKRQQERCVAVTGKIYNVAFQRESRNDSVVAVLPEMTLTTTITRFVAGGGEEK